MQPSEPAGLSGDNTLQVKVASVTTDEEGKESTSDKTESCGPTVTLQNGAETTAYTKVCKVTFSTEPSETDGDRVTFTAYNKNTTTASSTYSFYATYHNGGYYRYIPPFSVTSTEGSTTETTEYNNSGCYLIFSPQADTDKERRTSAWRDINHVSEGNPNDKTYMLNPTWTSGSESIEAADIENNWNGAATAKGITVSSGKTITQTVAGLDTTAPYTVQMIVRGAENAKGTLKLEGATTVTDTMSFTSYTANGTISPNGRVDALYTTYQNDNWGENADGDPIKFTAYNNGWNKLETLAKPTSDGKLTISLSAASGALQLSDVTLIMNANTKGSIWTKAPTSSKVTEFPDLSKQTVADGTDLRDRTVANAYSFFDRGANLNAVIYSNSSTVLGRDEKALNIAHKKANSSQAKVRQRRADAPDTSVSYTMSNFALTDNNGSWTNDHSFRISQNIDISTLFYDRKFTKKSESDRSTICLPFAMTSDVITTLFGDNAKLYSISSVTESTPEVVYGTDVTETEANIPYIIDLDASNTTAEKDGVSNDIPVTLVATPSTDELKDSIENVGSLVGVYSYTNITCRQDNNFTYYCYDAQKSGRFIYFSKSGADTKPFRAYLRIKRTSTPAKKFYLFKIVDNTPTDIKPVSTDTYLMGNAPVYNVQGMYVGKGSDVKSLPAGVYIQNGRKFVKK